MKIIRNKLYLIFEYMYKLSKFNLQQRVLVVLQAVVAARWRVCEVSMGNIFPRRQTWETYKANEAGFTAKATCFDSTHPQTKILFWYGIVYKKQQKNYLLMIIYQALIKIKYIDALLIYWSWFFLFIYL